MRISFLLAGVAMAGLTAFSASAQDGQYAPALSRMLTEAAAGTCPTDLMADELLAACQGQIDAMAYGLNSLGEVETMTYLSTEATPEGPVEMYSVVFSSGATMTWGIGQMQDGKFRAAFGSMGGTGE
ncbi:hypothetical protein [Brevundimonas sp.]|uniref:hypothetical protein n=1 Tax=Brevundimonas sp. TaxID=1871086 RepID=UPI002AB8D555|nr:hypothetical protein [Brevundimonas sp.]MDZ4362124.1 hypothetical protein [Brevundimonas sp.]